MFPKKYYSVLSLILNLFIVFSSLLFLIYLAAPLFDGRLSLNALKIYGSWIGLGIILKLFFHKMKKNGHVKRYEILLACFYLIFCMFLWFSYTLGALFSVFIILGVVVSYKKQIAGKRENL